MELCIIFFRRRRHFLHEIEATVHNIHLAIVWTLTTSDVHDDLIFMQIDSSVCDVTICCIDSFRGEFQANRFNRRQNVTI